MGNRTEVQNRMIFLYGRRTDDLGNLVFQHQEFWVALANKKSQLHRAFNFTSMEYLWNEHMLTGAFDGQIELSARTILPLREVGVTTKSYLKDWAITLAKQLVNRVLVPGLDARPTHEGPAGGTHGVTLLKCTADVARVVFDDLGVDAFDMTPANTIGAPQVPPSFNSAAAQAALGEHLHASRTDYTLCSGCSQERKKSGRWHGNLCPVVFLRKADEYKTRVAAHRKFRQSGSNRKSISKGADDLFFFMSLEEREQVKLLASVTQPRSKKRGGVVGASTVCDVNSRDEDSDSSSSRSISGGDAMVMVGSGDDGDAMEVDSGGDSDSDDDEY